MFLLLYENTRACTAYKERHTAGSWKVGSMVPTGLMFGEVCSLLIMWCRSVVSSGGQTVSSRDKNDGCAESSVPPQLYKHHSHTGG